MAQHRRISGGVDSPMIVPTEAIQELFQGNGIIRDDSTPFTYVGYRGKDDEVLVMDESFAFQDTDMLIQDCETQGAQGIAEIIKDFVKRLRAKSVG